MPSPSRCVLLTGAAVLSSCLAACAPEGGRPTLADPPVSTTAVVEVIEDVNVAAAQPPGAGGSTTPEEDAAVVPLVMDTFRSALEGWTERPGPDLRTTGGTACAVPRAVALAGERSRTAGASLVLTNGLAAVHGVVTIHTDVPAAMAQFRAMQESAPEVGSCLAELLGPLATGEAGVEATDVVVEELDPRPLEAGQILGWRITATVERPDTGRAASMVGEWFEIVVGRSTVSVQSVAEDVPVQRALLIYETVASQLAVAVR